MNLKYTRKIKPPFLPLSLLPRQIGSAMLMAYSNGWDKFAHWLFHDSLKSIPTANGSYGMGCIGYPGHPAWEVTSACNLNCIHCHVAGGKPGPEELSTDEGKRLIDDLATTGIFRNLVYTGGEPLVRPDIFELLKHSKEAGFANILATNGTLIDEETAWKLKEHGVVCNAIGLDAANPSINNFIRNNPRVFDLVMRGMESTKKAGILLQVNTTAMEYNMPHLPELIDTADKNGASIMLMYQLVTIGRGGKIESASLGRDENRDLCELISSKQKRVKTVIEPVACPQYWPYILEKRGLNSGLWLKLAEKVFFGCSAGRGFAYIKSNGDVWPCPFVEITAGNVREKSFAEIYDKSDVFVNLRNRERTLKGSCKGCRYNSICGGCRAKAKVYTGDYLAEDPCCFIKNEWTLKRAPIENHRSGSPQ